MKTKITRRLEVNVEGMPWKVEQKNEVMNSRREMMKKKAENQCSWSNNNQENLTKGRIKKILCIENQRTHMSRLKRLTVVSA